jgi:hypothetical protein
MKNMKPVLGTFRIILTALLLWQTPSLFAAIKVTVNTTTDANTPDSEMSLVEAVYYLDKLAGTDLLGRDLTSGEAAQVTTISGTNDVIAFNISGTGQHVITANGGIDLGAGDLYSYPMLATNVVVDGYTQPGSSPNSNPILAPNNAVINIVIQGQAGVRHFGVAADHVKVKGLSLLNGDLGVGFGGGCVGGGVQGCWVGLSTNVGGGYTIQGQGQGLAAWETGGSQVFGTDGDGVNDRNEFNIVVASDELHIAVGDSENCRVSGNFINVMPDGLSSSGVDVGEGDGIYLEGLHSNTKIGTDSNGISDTDERNVVGGLDPSSDLIGAWTYGVTTNVLIMGNYFGVGIDGTTPLPLNKGFNNDSGMADGESCYWLIGSNGDGVRDDIEANIIANIKSGGRVFKFPSQRMNIEFRRNSFFGNDQDFFNGADGNKYSYNGWVLGLATDTAAISPVISNTTTRAELIGWVPVSGDGNNRTNALIHIYEADPSAADDRPQGKKWLATYADNGPQDLDSQTNYFRFNLCSLPISSTGAKITVNETCGDTDATDDSYVGSSRFATAFALPDVSNALSISKAVGSVTLTWQMNGVLQTNTSLTSPGTWGNVSGCSPVTLSVGAAPLFFRVAQ